MKSSLMTHRLQQEEVQQGAAVTSYSPQRNQEVAGEVAELRSK